MTASQSSLDEYRFAALRESGPMAAHFASAESSMPSRCFLSAEFSSWLDDVSEWSVGGHDRYRRFVLWLRYDNESNKLRSHRGYSSRKSWMSWELPIARGRKGYYCFIRRYCLGVAIDKLQPESIDETVL